ncbi:unnamed protein product [Ilex paraguariensis]|uniref:Uncharacterized protein n=1 Tax=Ilex paraguariensis TaxID=185542 RepID=A0ABC8U8I8_9AQUA
MTRPSPIIFKNLMIKCQVIRRNFFGPVVAPWVLARFSALSSPCSFTPFFIVSCSVALNLKKYKLLITPISYCHSTSRSQFSLLHKNFSYHFLLFQISFSL